MCQFFEKRSCVGAIHLFPRVHFMYSWKECSVSYDVLTHPRSSLTVLVPVRKASQYQKRYFHYCFESFLQIGGFRAIWISRHFFKPIKINLGNHFLLQPCLTYRAGTVARHTTCTHEREEPFSSHVMVFWILWPTYPFFPKLYSSVCLQFGGRVRKLYVVYVINLLLQGGVRFLSKTHRKTPPLPFLQKLFYGFVSARNNSKFDRYKGANYRRMFVAFSR